MKIAPHFLKSEATKLFCRATYIAANCINTQGIHGFAKSLKVCKFEIFFQRFEYFGI